MNTFLNAVGILLLLAGIALPLVLTALRREYEDQKAKKVRWPYLLAALGLVLFIFGNSFAIVPTGYTGVRTTFGMIDQESCMPGYNAKTPFVQHITLVNNKQQDKHFNDRVWSETTEQVVVYMEDVTVSYRIVPESSAWIFANVENWVENLVDENIVNSALKSASRKLTADIVTDRGVIEPSAKEELQTAVDSKYGKNRIQILNVIIGNMDFEDSYNAAIAKKSEAMQEQQEQAIRNQTAIDKATAEAEAARVAAQGQADAERILAEGKAKANEILTNSITDATQKQDAIEKWDGQLPRYVGGENDSFGIMDTVS